MGCYQDPEQQQWLVDEYKRLGKKLDMGKSCLRFKKLEDVPLHVVGKIVATTPPEALIELSEESRRRHPGTRGERQSNPSGGA